MIMLSRLYVAFQIFFFDEATSHSSVFVSEIASFGASPIKRKQTSPLSHIINKKRIR